MYTLVFYLAIVNKVLRHCHSWLARHYQWFTILGLWVLGLAVSNINESQLQTYESRTLLLMTSPQYYCILGLAEIKLCIPETKLFAKDARCAGNKITKFRDSYYGLYPSNSLVGEGTAQQQQIWGLEKYIWICFVFQWRLECWKWNQVINADFEMLLGI